MVHDFGKPCLSSSDSKTDGVTHSFVSLRVVNMVFLKLTSIYVSALFLKNLCYEKYYCFVIFFSKGKVLVS